MHPEPSDVVFEVSPYSHTGSKLEHMYLWVHGRATSCPGVSWASWPWPLPLAPLSLPPCPGPGEPACCTLFPLPVSARQKLLNIVLTPGGQESESQNHLSSVHADKEVIICLHISRPWYWEGICRKAGGGWDQTPRLQINVTCRDITEAREEQMTLLTEELQNGVSQLLVHCSHV